MRFIKWVEHRQSVLWHMEPKASKRLIRSWDQAIFLWHCTKKAVYGHVSIDSIAYPSEIFSTGR